MKKCEVIFDEEAKIMIENNKLLTEFVKTTGNDGVIKIYGTVLPPRTLSTKTTRSL